jgi:hypothetical protein
MARFGPTRPRASLMLSGEWPGVDGVLHAAEFNLVAVVESF